MIGRGTIHGLALVGGRIDPEIADLQMLEPPPRLAPTVPAEEPAKVLERARLLAAVLADFDAAFFPVAISSCGLSHYQIEQLAKLWHRFRRSACRTALSADAPPTEAAGP